MDMLVAEGSCLCKSSFGRYAMLRTFSEECICHAAKEDEDDYIFMYEILFVNLGISLPFDCFAVDVLKTLEVAPSQLHPNGWEVLQAFGGFKNHFVKVLPIKDTPFAIDEKLIPLYWRLPNKLKRGKLASPQQASPRLELSGGGSGLLLPQSYFLVEGDFCQKRYDLGALINESDNIVKGKLEKAEANAAKAKAISAAPSSTTEPKITIKPIPPPHTLIETATTKRKVAPSTEEVTLKKGKTIEGSSLQSSQVDPRPTLASPVVTSTQPTPQTISKPGPVPSLKLIATPTLPLVVLTLVGPVVGTLELLRGGLPCFMASPGISSLWSPRLDTSALLNSVGVSQYDRKLLPSAGSRSSLNVMATYCARTMAIVEVLKPIVNKLEQLVWEESFEWQEVARLLNNNSKLRKANQRYNEENVKVKADFVSL
ncbi:hypothetical protein CR513_27770, partial [Mucuna pruriens]